MIPVFCFDYAMFYLYRESNLKQLATLEISDGMEPKAIFGKDLVKKIILVKSRFFLGLKIPLNTETWVVSLIFQVLEMYIQDLELHDLGSQMLKI